MIWKALVIVRHLFSIKREMEYLLLFCFCFSIASIQRAFGHEHSQGSSPTPAPVAGVPLPVAEAIDSTIRGKATGAILVGSNGRVLWSGSVGNPASGISAPDRSAA